MQPFIPPARPLIGEEEIDAVAAVMRTGMIAQGPQVAAFEEEFAATLVPGTHAVAVNSGTSALHLGLLAAGIEPGDEVIVPSFTFAATANSVAITGATPVFADIDPLTFTLSPAAVEAAITPRTRAIMPVHLYGHPAPMEALQAIADAHGLMLFEVAAQAHGATLHGRAVGSFGTFAAFSFYPTKNMTCGEGGMVRAGGLATLGVDYYKLGFQTGVMAADILSGKAKPAEMAIQAQKDFKPVINMKSAAKIGLTVPEELLKDAEVIK